MHCRTRAFRLNSAYKMFDCDDANDYVDAVEGKIGTVESLHLHPEVAGKELRAVSEVFAEAGKGLVGDARVFGRMNQKGEASRRQVSLIAREEIARHADALGLAEIPPGAVRSNIETAGLDLVSFLGREMEVGEAVLLFYEARTPCWKMDRIAPGLQAMMGQGRQGVMARVIRSGWIRIGDGIRPLADSGAQRRAAVSAS